jgi:hypothetical protein
MQRLRSAVSNGHSWVGASPPFHLSMETDPIYEITILQNAKAMEKIQKLNNLKCKILWSEPFRINECT